MEKLKSVVWIDANPKKENNWTRIAYFGSMRIAVIRVEIRRDNVIVLCKILFPVSEKSEFPNSYSTQKGAEEAVEYFWERLINEVSS